MIIDNNFAFSKAQALTGTSDVISSNVFDAGSAKKVFQGQHKAKLAFQISASGGSTPTCRARFVGADNDALTTNPVILADTGDSKVLAAADIPYIAELVPVHQHDAKRYYGVIYLQTGSSPTATVSASLVMDAQSNMVK